MARKLLTLTFRGLTLVFVSNSSPEVAAFTACENCATTYYWCREECYVSYSQCMVEVGDDELCVGFFGSCQGTCSAQYDQCALTHCGSGGGPVVLPGGCGYSIYSLYPGLRDECIAGTSFMDVFEQCENVSPSERENCCNGQYDYYLSTVCQCTLDPRVPSCLASPP